MQRLSNRHSSSFSIISGATNGAHTDIPVKTSLGPLQPDSSLTLPQRLYCWARTLWYNAFISPVFLGLMISVILFLPSRLLQSKHLSSRVILRFLRKLLKRGVDIAGALLGLLFSAVPFLFLPILIKLDSRGRAIFRQVRVGRNRRKEDRRVMSVAVPNERRIGARREEDLLGQPFDVYKFRSMKENAEKKTGPVWATLNDPRITGVGRLLRPYHIDELPQFINVLRGDMSLVGPRPERPEFVNRLKQEVPRYALRFKRKPGLTGLAQINCGYDRTISDVYEKLKFDIEYIDRLAIRRDLVIMWNTLRKLTSGEGAAVGTISNRMHPASISRKNLTKMNGNNDE